MCKPIPSIALFARLRNFLLRYIPLSFWCIIGLSIPMVACVHIQQPEGGAMDVEPPKLIHSFPENDALNCKDVKVLCFTFDKQITADNIHHNLLITPKLDKHKNKLPYSYKVQGKKLKIRLNVPLKADTTYSFYLNNAVKNPHEGTKAVNAVLTFSTGLFIDPITVKGKVKELLSNKAVEGANVYLYNAKRDPTAWQKSKEEADYNQEESIPDYYTTTDQEGNFTINHIARGQYYLRGVTGKINNHQIDYKKEFYGFFKNPIDLKDSQEGIILPLVTADVRDLKYLHTDPRKGFCDVILNKPIKKYQLLADQTIGIKGRTQVYSCLSQTAPETIRIYNTFNLLSDECLNLKLTAEDAFDMVLEQDLSIKFREGKPELSKTSLDFNVLPRLFPSVRPEFTESITFNKPIKAFNQDLIYFRCKDNKNISFKPEELVWNTDKTALTIKKDFLQEELLQLLTNTEQDNENKRIQRIIILQLDAGACTAFDQDKNNAIKLSYPLRNEEETGTISGNIETSIADFIVELLHPINYEVVDSIRNAQHYQFTMVPPGSYKVRIRAVNKVNGEWSPGNIRKAIEPDLVVFYDNDVTVVEKWDTQDINFKF